MPTRKAHLLAITQKIPIFANVLIKKGIKMSYLIKPDNYKAKLDLKQTELGIKQIKDFFQQNLSSELRLRRVTAPLFVLKGMGINDDLSGTERAVSFPIKDLNDAQAEVVTKLGPRNPNMIEI